MIRALKAFLASVGFICVGCSSLFYYPTHEKYYDPEKYFGLRPQDIYLTLKDGPKLHGWFFKSQTGKSQGTLIQFHGNAENLSSHYTMLVWAPRQGYDLLIFDYPGYGESQGSPSPTSTVKSGVEFLHWANQNASKPLIIYGHSLGGIVALRSYEKVKDQIPFKAVIIDASFDSYQNIAKEKMALSWLTWPFQFLSNILISDSQAPSNLKKISPTPILFIHGKKDRVIPFHHSERMFEKAEHPKELWLIENAGHGNTYMVEDGRYQKLLLDYLNKIPAK